MTRFDKTLLWRLAAKENKGESFVFGTMHVRDDRAMHFAPLLHPYILACEAYAAEYRLDDLDPAQLARRMYLPDGLLLKDLIKRRAYRRLNTLFTTQTGLPLDGFKNRKPFLISSLLTDTLFAQDHAEALDEALYSFAKSNQKLLLGVETFDEQMAVLDNMPLDLQVRYLLNTVKTYGSQADAAEKLAAAYRHQRLHQLYKIAKKGLKGIKKNLLTERNQRMTDRIAGISQKMPVFVAVGAAHLAGKQGILALLSQQNITCTPVLL